MERSDNRKSEADSRAELVALGQSPDCQTGCVSGLERSDKMKRIAVVPGDGIGKEVIPAALKVVEATGAAVEFTTFDWSADRYLKDGTTIPADGA